MNSKRRESERSSIQGDNASEDPELMKDINLIYTYHRDIVEHQKQTEDLRSNQRRDIGSL